MYLEALKAIPPVREEDDHREEGRHRARAVNVFIETPTGSRDKFELNHDTGLLEWSLQLPLGLSFPFAFGFVPNTLADDGDALDICLLVDGVIPPGTIVPSRLIGVLTVSQDESGDGETDTRNDRILAVPTLAQSYGDVDDVHELRDGFYEEVARFFERYNQLIDRAFDFGEPGDRDEAYRRLDQAVERAAS